MRKFFSIAGLIILMFEWAGAAPLNPQVKQSDARVQQISMLIHYGDQISKFLVTEESGSLILSFESSNNKGKRTTLTRENFEYILSEFEKLPQAKVVPKTCANSSVIVRVKQKEKKSCIAVRTITSERYERFINILTMALRI